MDTVRLSKAFKILTPSEFKIYYRCQELDSIEPTSYKGINLDPHQFVLTSGDIIEILDTENMKDSKQACRLMDRLVEKKVIGFVKLISIRNDRGYITRCRIYANFPSDINVSRVCLTGSHREEPQNCPTDLSHHKILRTNIYNKVSNNIGNADPISAIPPSVDEKEEVSSSRGPSFVGPEVVVCGNNKSYVSKYTLAGKEKELYDLLFKKTHVPEFKVWNDSYKEKIAREIPIEYQLDERKFYSDGELVINPTKVKKSLNLTDIAEADDIISSLIYKRYIHVIDERSKPGEYQLIYVNTPKDMEVLKVQEELSSRIIDGKIPVVRTNTGDTERIIRKIEDVVEEWTKPLKKLESKSIALFHIKRIVDKNLFSDFNMNELKVNREVLKYVN